MNSSEDAGSAASDGRGRDAKYPWQLPWLGWKDVLWRVAKEVPDDRLKLVAASVAFYGLLALFPALIATVLLYGLFADPSDITNQIEAVAVALPSSARVLVTEEMHAIVQSSRTQLTVGLIVSLAISFYGTSTGMKALIESIGIAYDEEEHRGWVAERLIALAFSFGIAVFVICSVAAITVMPSVLEFVGIETSKRALLKLVRWPALFLAGIVGLSLLYRYAPNRTPARWQWIVVGALLAGMIWLLASIAFSTYVEHFGRFNQTYGTLGGVVVLLLWLFVSAFAILLGAELNAELEHQTEVDTTIGPPAPIGERGAKVADALGETAPMGSSRFPGSAAEGLRHLLRVRERKSTLER